MKAIPFIIIFITIISLSGNIFLLFNKDYTTPYFFWVNLITGACLITNIILLVLSRNHLAKRQSDYVHKIFHKN